MLFNPRRKRHFALTGDTKSSVFAEIINKQSGKQTLKIIAQSEGAITDEFTYPRLLSGITESLYGNMSVALPLHCFDIITIPLPVMPDEALGRALPYHLAKATNKPLSDFIYDWQVTQRQKDKLQVTVYLMPAKLFNHMRTEFSRKQVSIPYLEADIFAAYAYLDSNNRLSDEDTSLCVIIWPEHVSLAVYEKNTLIVSRTVAAMQPNTKFTGISNNFTVEENIPAEKSLDLEPELIVQLNENVPEEAESPPSSEEDAIDHESILEDFALMSKSGPKKTKKETLHPADNTADMEKDIFDKKNNITQSGDQTWDDYLQHINLEIMRTRDYHSSVLKGGAIKNVYVSGADKFWEELRTTTRNALGIDMEALESKQSTENISPTFNAICLGTGTRW